MSASTHSSCKAETNRLNARKSTGPKSLEGKRRASRNAVTHGLFAQGPVLLDEDKEAFALFAELMLRRLNPRDILEMQIVERIISVSWRLKRVAAAEKMLYEAREYGIRKKQIKKLSARIADDLPASMMMVKMLQDSDDSALERLHLYERRLQNSLHRCLRELRELREEEHDEFEPLSRFARIVLENEGENENEKTKPKMSEVLVEAEVNREETIAEKPRAGNNGAGENALR